MPEDNKKAAALKYEPAQDEAPRLLAKGKGLTAERIIELAKKHDIPIKEDADLIEALMQLDLEEMIPPELYKVVAEILAFVYKLNNARKERAG